MACLSSLPTCLSLSSRSSRSLSRRATEALLRSSSSDNIATSLLLSLQQTFTKQYAGLRRAAVTPACAQGQIAMIRRHHRSRLQGRFVPSNRPHSRTSDHLLCASAPKCVACCPAPKGVTCAPWLKLPAPKGVLLCGVKKPLLPLLTLLRGVGEVGLAEDTCISKASLSDVRLITSAASALFSAVSASFWPVNSCISVANGSSLLRSSS